MNKALKKIRYSISYRFAIDALIYGFSFAVVFHILVILQLIPYHIVWAGKLKNIEEMYQMEGVSLLLNSLMLWICYRKKNTPPEHNNQPRLYTWYFTAISILFFLNTIGNVFFPSTLFERVVFSPLTLALSAFSFRVAIE